MPLQTGPLIDGMYSVEYAVTGLAKPPTTSSIGAVLREYSAREVSQAEKEKAPPATRKKTGARIDVYDSVLMAVLAGEF